MKYSKTHHLLLEKYKLGYVLIVFIILGSLAVWADQIQLQSGQILDAVILTEQDSGLRVQTTVGVLSIPRNQINSIRHESPAIGYLRLAETVANEQQYATAIPFYLKSLQYDPNNIAVQEKVRKFQFLQLRKTELAEIDSLLNEQKYEAAINLYRHVLQVHNDKPYSTEMKAELAKIYVMYAKYYYNRYFTEGVLKNLREAYRLDAQCKEVHQMLAIMQRDEGLETLSNWEQEKSYELALAQTEQEKIIAETLSTAISDTGPDIPSSAYWEELNRLASLEPVRPELVKRPTLNETGYPSKIAKWLHLVLQAYNAGPKAVVVYDGNVPYQETKDYVVRVHQWLNQSLNDNGFDELIHRYAKAYGLEPELVKAIIKVESDFNPKARSNKNARGLMQLTQHAWNDMVALLGVNWNFHQSAYEPEKNIAVGCRYLAWLKTQFLPKYFDISS
ncbi:MAG: transglycosylase SLT domain-containing protein [bacterium]|nr:transglycosylase SLT domain-containing protein [bacterium]